MQRHHPGGRRAPLRLQARWVVPIFFEMIKHTLEEMVTWVIYLRQRRICWASTSKEHAKLEPFARNGADPNLYSKDFPMASTGTRRHADHSLFRTPRA
mmetsp:Transcript_127875/g.368312  ORF Transcript_127875/g.368312 Transcript_127875/m.368312 type:complete len:98 (-) Transcript_127875:740-1033(-)